MDRDTYSLGHPIGYTTLEEWEANTPNVSFAGQGPTRADMVICLTLTDKSEGRDPPLVRTTLQVQRMDERGDIHYWRLHLATMLYAGGQPLFEPDRTIRASGETAYQLVKVWLGTKGFQRLVSAQIALHKDLVLLDGHTDLLRFDKERGWYAAPPKETS